MTVTVSPLVRASERSANFTSRRNVITKTPPTWVSRNAGAEIDSAPANFFTAPRADRRGDPASAPIPNGDRGSSVPPRKAPAGSMRQVRTLPTFSVRIRPLSSSTCRCCTTAARVMASGSARRDTEIGPWLTFCTMARRVGSPSAWKTRSMSIFKRGMGGLGLGLAGQVGGQVFQQLAPSLFAHLRDRRSPRRMRPDR